MTAFLLILVSFAMLAAAAFCAGAETGFLSVGRARVLHLAREGGRKAQIVQRALSDMSRTMTTLLIGNNLASVAYSSATAALLLEVDSAFRAVGSFLAAFLVLYFSEFMPKLLCSARPLRRILMLAPAYRVVEAALRPLADVALALTGLFVRNGRTDFRPTKADIVGILRDRKDGVCLTDLESALIGRILVLRAKGKPVNADTLLSALDA